MNTESDTWQTSANLEMDNIEKFLSNEVNFELPF